MAHEQAMTLEQIAQFAEEWVDAWSRKDVEAVLAHFDDEVQFTSPRAAATVGTATVAGKADLRAYWLAALARIDTIRFSLDHIVWDAQRQELVIVYTNEINGARTRACEFMRFGPHGRIVEAEAMHGANT